jgi:hypothetical protein
VEPSAALAVAEHALVHGQAALAARLLAILLTEAPRLSEEAGSIAATLAHTAAALAADVDTAAPSRSLHAAATACDVRPVGPWRGRR